ncbi:MAG: ABC transporter permease, partial [Planctomycetes bacterium]|nr:ABC transporter permease [Planctomycetota bacterium]
MGLMRLVLREMLERKAQLVMSFVAVALGILVIVSVRTISHFSGIAVATTVDNLGANILVMPKETSIDNYYRSDFVDATLPEEYVRRITTSDLRGVNNMSPRLVIRDVPVGDRRVNLTGVLPKDEFPRRPDWASPGDLFTEPVDVCGVSPTLNASAAENAVRRKNIAHLGRDECFVGSEVASDHGLGAGSVLEIGGRRFRVVEVLPATGTVDDTRVLANLHVVQEMYKTGPVINLIEIVGCCREVSQGLHAGLNDLLPAARVVTIGQIVSTQLETERLMEKSGTIFLVIICIVGILSIGNDMFSSVHERRREIGILLAIGATPGRILRMFLLKALVLGVAGGVFGYLGGTLLAVLLGPSVAGMPVSPRMVLLPLSLLVAVAIA